MSLRKKSHGMDMKLITNQEELAQIDNINYTYFQGHEPPVNTPMTPGIISPWMNVIIDDSCKLSWNQNIYQFQEQMIQQLTVPTPQIVPTVNTYSRALLKEMMKLDFSSTQKYRQCKKELNQSDYFKQQNPGYVQDPPNIPLKQQQPRQQPQNYLVRHVDDPFVKHKKDEMREQQKWLEIQKQIGSKESQFTKDLKFRLNQLAPQNYKQISQQVINLILKDADLQTSALVYILEKGAIEDKYRNLYAQLIQQVLSAVKNASQVKCQIELLLLNMLGAPDYSKISDAMAHLNENDKLIYQTKRKKKYIGYNKLIGTLFMESILPYQFVDRVFCTNIQCFVTQHNIKDKSADQKRISEEPIEAIMALLQVCGRAYIAQESTTNWQLFLDQLGSQSDEFVHFSQKGLTLFIDALMKQYAISQRVSILLQNLREEVVNKFSGQTKKVKKNVESSDDEDYGHAIPITKLKSLKHILEDEDDQLLSSKKPLTDKDIILIVDQCFKSSGDIYVVLQTKLMNRITTESHWTLFWRSLLSSLLDISPANMLRIQLPYQIFEPYRDFCNSNMIMMQLNELLQDKIFDIVESPYGLEFLSKLIRPFIMDNFSCLLEIKLDEQQEEIQQFYIKLMARVITQELLQSEVNISAISQFFVNNLMLSVEQQQVMWESIK